MRFVAIDTSAALSHYGVLGMKWGVRRYQNKDGSLTAAGKKRQQRRDETVATQKRWIDEYEKDQKYAQNALSDIRKKGSNSKFVRDMYENGDFQEGLVDHKTKSGGSFFNEKTGEIKPFDKLSKADKKYIVERVKEVHSRDADLSWQINRSKKIIENVSKTPINKRSYSEATLTDTRVQKGYAIAGAILPVVGSIAMSKLSGNDSYTTAKRAVKAALLYSPIGAGVAALNAPDIQGQYYNKYIKGK